ncbi:MAG: hypothetical protein JSS93_03285 [Bacteroidetes bacterium]|nr:hypothetical protein [Bacteroidota bacterium]
MLAHFKSAKKIKEASWEDLIELVGKKNAEKIKKGLNKN